MKKLRICPLCEATCGLEIEIEGREVKAVRGDAADPFGEGYICPKGAALGELHADPDRLREPLVRDDDGWRATTWDEAFETIDGNLTAIRSRHGKDAIGLYLGNPTVHNTALTLYLPALRQALETRNVFTASSVDQLPKQFVLALMLGNGLSVPIPDLDRCRYLLILGANPLVSNGSLLTAPNIGERLARLRRRGGKIVVVDPCRTRTARAADDHLAIRPGTDALFLFAIVNTLFAADLVCPGRLAQHLAGLDRVGELATPFTADVVSSHCGIDAARIRQVARDIAAADGAAVYGRLGTCTQQFGTLASWLPEVIHVLTGNLDHEGGAMFTTPAHGPANTKGAPGVGRGVRMDRWRSRVRACPEIFGELPSACLAEEIDSPGDGSIRALITVAGNPVVSTPNSTRLARALESLEFMVSLDIHLNETTRHAKVILPGLSPLEIDHYDIIFSQLAIENWARYSPRLLDPPAGQLGEWETILRLVGILTGMGPDANIETLDDRVVDTLIRRETRTVTSTLHDRDPAEIIEALGSRCGPERIIDFMLRTGPHGEGFGTLPDGLSLDALLQNPRGVNLGPLRPRIPEVLRTPSGKIELAPAPIVDDVARLRESLRDNGNSVDQVNQMVLIGRRHLRSNNSWMHNVPSLMTGRPRCTVHVNPADAGRLGLDNGDLAAVTSRVGSIDIPVEITADIAPGVVSIPHGWGHHDPALRLGVASAHAGVNTNELADEMLLDVPSGTAVLCGIPVSVSRAPADSRRE